MTIDTLLSISVPAEEALAEEPREIRIRAKTRDIGWGGFCLDIPRLPENRTFTPAKAHMLLGRPVTLNIIDARLRLWGHVIRFDARTGILAVIISKTSDIETWQQLCNGSKKE